MEHESNILAMPRRF